jgi:hypothetical protein
MAVHQADHSGATLNRSPGRHGVALQIADQNLSIFRGYSFGKIGSRSTFLAYPVKTYTH